MTIASSVPAVVDAVLALCARVLTGQVDSVSGSPVEVVDGELGTRVPNEFVQIVGVQGGQQSWAAVGRQRRNEAYAIVGMVRVYVGNDDQQYCRRRAFELFARLESGLDDDPFVGGVVNGSVQSSASDLRMGVTDHGGRAAELDFLLSVTTQLIAT